MQKVSYMSLENILANDPLPRMSKKGWIFDFRILEEAVSLRFLIILFSSTAHERITIGYVVS